MSDQEDYFKILSDINNRFKQISKKLSAFTLVLLEDGWFFDYSIPINFHFQEIAQYDKVIFNLYMEKHFEDNIAQIERLAIMRFPKRGDIIQKAIRAHKNGDYELSIPVLIGQADGIFREITSKELYSKKENIKAEAIIEDIERNKFKEYSTWVLEPLRKTQIISANFKESKDKPEFLHRNPILHGVDLNYANKRNGLKSLSLLNYVVKIVYDLYVSVDMTEFLSFIEENIKNGNRLE